MKDDVIQLILNKRTEYAVYTGRFPTTVYLGLENMVELMTLAKRLLIRKQSDTEKYVREKRNCPRKEIEIASNMVVGLKIIRVLEDNYLEVA